MLLENHSNWYYLNFFLTSSFHWFQCMVWYIVTNVWVFEYLCWCPREFGPHQIWPSRCIFCSKYGPMGVQTRCEFGLPSRILNFLDDFIIVFLEFWIKEFWIILVNHLKKTVRLKNSIGIYFFRLKNPQSLWWSLCCNMGLFLWSVKKCAKSA